jgi:hypothetical protein
MVVQAPGKKVANRRKKSGYNTIKWLEYDPSMSLIKFTKVHMGSDKILILKSNVEENTFLRIGREDYFKNLLATTNCYEKARMVGVPKEMLQDTKVKGLPDSIDPTKPPRNYRHAMSLPDAQEWAEAYDKEYMGIKQRGVFETVRMEKGMKIMGMTTRTEYKVTNGVFGKRKVRLCARGDQQIEGLQFNQRDIYSPVLKSAEVRLMVAIAAQHGAKMYKTDTTQAFLYGDVEEDLYVQAPDWWPELVPEGHCLQLKKNIYGTRQAARAWHLRISGWMESHGYPAINSEKTMFMKWEGDDFILHGLFVDDMSTVPTSDHLKEEFVALQALLG